MAMGPGGRYPRAKAKDPDSGKDENKNYAPTGGKQGQSKAFGPVEHMHQSAPGKIEKKPGAALNTKEPKGGVGKEPLMGMGMKGKGGFSGTDRPQTKDFKIHVAVDHPLGDYAKADEPTNHTGRALQDAMLGPGGEKAHVSRISRDTDRGAGMREDSEFAKGGENEATGALGSLERRGA